MLLSNDSTTLYWLRELFTHADVKLKRLKEAREAVRFGLTVTIAPEYPLTLMYVILKLVLNAFDCLNKSSI